MARKKSAKTTPSARATLEKRSMKVLRRLTEISGADELKDVLGPLVSKRHSLAKFQSAARDLLVEREAARAKRMGEPILSEAEQAALKVAGSRLLGLTEGGSPLASLSDEALEAVREERDPERLAEKLGSLDPEGNWESVPRMGLLTGIVLVSVSSEAEKRWRAKEAENLARTRARRERQERQAAS